MTEMSILTPLLLQRPSWEPSAADSGACGAAHVSGSAGVWPGKLQPGRGAAQTHQRPLCRDRGQWRTGLSPLHYSVYKISSVSILNNLFICSSAERCFQSAPYSCCHEVWRQRTPTICQVKLCYTLLSEKWFSNSSFVLLCCTFKELLGLQFKLETHYHNLFF